MAREAGLPTPAAKPRRLFLVGMGGSSLPGDLVNDYLQGGIARFEFVRDYRLPAGAGKEDLAVTSSFSGNTEETLEALETLIAKGIPTVALSNGGKLKERALAAGLPFVPIPDCIQPRCANGHFFASLLVILDTAGLVPDPRETLAQLAGFLEDRRDAHEAEGKKLAAELKDRVPLIYGPAEFEGTCRVWKIKINENAKVQSFSNVVPELNHNEMVGFTRLVMNPIVIQLRSRFTHPKILKRMDVMRNLLQDKMPFYDLALQGSAPIQEMFDSLAVADYATYHLAKAYGIDPAPVAMVEDFKKRL